MSYESDSVSYGRHQPVLLNHCLELLIKPVLGRAQDSQPIKVLDLTFGGGGHSLAFLKESSHVHVTGVDQDMEAIANAKKFLAEKNITDRVTLVHSNFYSYLKSCQTSYDVILADIGVSSHQIDAPSRGFSFHHDGPLDMRMDQSSSVSDTIINANTIVNDYSAEDLLEIITKYGEERYAKNIVRNICEKRLEGPITTTRQLEDICFHSYPARKRHIGIHPATRTFQALRIAVNQELEVLEKSLPLSLNLLNTGGRLGIISFHSLEDRIVKHYFRDVAQKMKNYYIITKRPVIANEKERAENSRSRSAKLRVIGCN